MTTKSAPGRKRSDVAGIARHVELEAVLARQVVQGVDQLQTVALGAGAFGTQGPGCVDTNEHGRGEKREARSEKRDAGEGCEAEHANV